MNSDELLVRYGTRLILDGVKLPGGCPLLPGRTEPPVERVITLDSEPPSATDRIH